MNLLFRIKMWCYLQDLRIENVLSLCVCVVLRNDKLIQTFDIFAAQVNRTTTNAGPEIC